jgi:uncharacterized caspase-like protein
VNRQLLCVALFAAVSASHAVAQAPSDGKATTDKRVALVIGNAAYVVGRLNNPVHDGRAMAESLRQLGFEVLAHENLSFRGMRRAVAEFGERITSGGIGLFYYSGHGLQVNGKNYLVPVDADIKNERYVAAESVDADSVLVQMQEGKTRVNVVILDACRDNPFAGRARGLGRGLAFMDVPTGTYVAYSTAPGSLAEDGEPGQNGIYTSELLKALREPGLRIEDVFKRVRIAVQSRTQQRQNPWDASSMTGDFFFNVTTAAVAPVPTPRVREEVRPEVGVLALTAGIEGVEVFLDDQLIGETRRGRALVVDNLTAGPHRLRVRRDGYRSWERVVQVAANQRLELAIDIEPVRQELTPPPGEPGLD